MDAAQDQRAVFDFLADPKTHGLDHAVTRIDTHGAALFLAGGTVYKVKRAVRYAYMDFSSLDKRRQACAAEVALNRPHAPGIYRDVAAITQDENGALHLDGPGTAIEWAVRMNRFDERRTLDRIALDEPLIHALARGIAAMHRQAPPCPAFDFARRLQRDIQDNRQCLLNHPRMVDRGKVEALGTASHTALAGVAALLDERRRDGFVRRCHGDLHLRNLVLWQGEPVPFDALEFDDAMATTDVLHDLAFLLMDIVARGHGFEANLLFNRYLIAAGSGVHDRALAALPLFISIRAAIRAKVAADLAMLHTDGQAAAIEDAQTYLALAGRALARPAPRLIAIGGLSGSGKSTLAKMLAADLGPMPGAVHLRSDVERKAMLGCPEDRPLPESGYTTAVTAQVYARLYRRAATLLAAGHSVMIDAVSQRADERQAAEAVARQAGARFDGLWLEAPIGTLAARVTARTGDASDAGPDIVRSQAARDCGALSWTRLDTSAGLAATTDKARAVLGLASAL